MTSTKHATKVNINTAHMRSPKYVENIETSQPRFKESSELQLKTATNAEYKQNDISLKAKLYDKFPVREMVRRGWIETSNNIDVLVSRFCEFFEIPTLDDAPNFNHAAKKSTSYADENNQAQNAWLFRARKLAKAAFTQNKYTQARLKTCFDK